MDSTLILDYLMATEPRMSVLAPSAPAKRLKALRAAGLALVVTEKAVRRHYERAFRPAEKLHQPWVDRVMGQLNGALAALDAELPKSGWIAGDALGLADIAATFAYSFVRLVHGGLIKADVYPNLADFCTRAEALPTFRAAPPQDGVTAPLAVAD